ncbi:MAG TPA: serine/threonine-protein kinase [Gemmatimonadaceae bacterium]|nr:serine/threonine-protein kinase [Gemmatimonadaceae bacterium]
MSTFRVCLQCGNQFGVEQRNCPNDGSALQLKATDDPLIDKTIADRYLIKELLGVGGMGRVYVAEHVALGRKSAVKVINPSHANSAEAISRFNREAANASRINHPNVAQIYDFGESDGVLYLAMEYIEGEALATTIERLGPIAAPRAANITMQVADALAAAHQLGIVHRDLKPENIMIGRKHDGTDWVKVVDFGIAKTMEAEHNQNVTMVGVSMGTPEYMSPEQFTGEKLDHRSDIYSLALVLFNMLTGQLPFPRVTSKETLVKRLTSNPVPLAEARPNTAWPPGLQTALDRALAPDATDRYGRVLDFATDVVRASERTPVLVQKAQVAVQTPVSVEEQPEPAKRPEPPKRQPVWPIFAWLILIAAIGTGFFYLRRIEQLLGIQLPGTAPKPVAVATAPPIDSLLQAPVVPQGEAVDSTDQTSALHNAAQTPSTQPNGDKSGGTSVPATGATTSVAQTTQPTTTQSAALPPTRSDSLTSRSLLRHPWLRANGDSGAPRLADEGVAPDVLRQMRFDELQGHLALVRRYAARGDVAHARAAYRDASEEGRGLALGDRTIEQRINLMLSMAQRDAMQACQSAHADTLNPFAAQVDCGTLFAW